MFKMYKLNNPGGKVEECAVARTKEEAAQVLNWYFYGEDEGDIRADELEEINVVSENGLWEKYQKKFTEPVYFGYIENGEIKRIIGEEWRGGFSWMP